MGIIGPRKVRTPGPADTPVTVTDGWAVCWDGEQHHGGTKLAVDADTAAQWTAAGWATPTPARAATPARPPTRTSSEPS